MAPIDISRPLSAATAPFPGDTPTDFALTSSISPTCPVNVGRLTCSTHAATHIDAPFHYLPTGQTIDQLDLSLFLGPAIVVDIPPSSAHITPDHLPPSPAPLPPRLLLRTRAWPVHSAFPTTFPTLAPGLAATLAARGVRLLGIDLPSVDLPDSKTLPIHLELAHANILILESLDLSSPLIFPNTPYHLTALPLNLTSADASPTRAILSPLHTPTPPAT